MFRGPAAALRCGKLALLAWLLAGCGRLGYEPWVWPGQGGDGSAPDAPAATGGDQDAAPPDEAGRPDAPSLPEGGPFEVMPPQGLDAPSDRGLTDTAASDMRMADGPGPDTTVSKPLPTCAAVLSFPVTFDQDPTGQDANMDGINDWAFDRSSKPKPADFVGGTWQPKTNFILDSRPRRAWNTRTIMYARMRNISVDTTQVFAMGALVWLNLDNDTSNIQAVYVSLQHQSSGGQTLLLGANGAPNNGTLTSITGLPDALVDVAVDVDPRKQTADLWVSGQWVGQYPVPKTGSNPGDDYATIATFQGPSIFDEVRILSCP